MSSGSSLSLLNFATRRHLTESRWKNEEVAYMKNQNCRSSSIRFDLRKSFSSLTISRNVKAVSISRQRFRVQFISSSKAISLYFSSPSPRGRRDLVISPAEKGNRRQRSHPVPLTKFRHRFPMEIPVNATSFACPAFEFREFFICLFRDGTFLLSFFCSSSSSFFSFRPQRSR